MSKQTNRTSTSPTPKTASGKDKTQTSQSRRQGGNQSKATISQPRTLASRVNERRQSSEPRTSASNQSKTTTKPQGGNQSGRAARPETSASRVNERRQSSEPRTSATGQSKTTTKPQGGSQSGRTSSQPRTPASRVNDRRQSSEPVTPAGNCGQTQYMEEKLTLIRRLINVIKSIPPKFPFWARLKIGKNRTTLVIDEDLVYDKQKKKMVPGYVHREATHSENTKNNETITPNPDESDPKPMQLKRPRKTPKRFFEPHNKKLNMPEKLKNQYKNNNNKGKKDK